ncbi:response regulator [Ruegeria arenilitoris]|uniref:response regulator n=1 Tax=Ruegeria arenilitoris TaxID=1173585 RepID=UPI00147C7D1E|nr:response regulator transcription factor [Ruegeria arenilitoris]
MKVLVAEDDKKTADFVNSGLQANGFSVEWYEDGRDALSYCLYNDCDAIILDRMLPGMDGLSVLKALRAAKRLTPVLFLTSIGDVQDRVEGLTEGADDYLVKPFHFSELLARLHSIIKRHSAGVTTTELHVHDLSMNLLSRVVKRQSETIELLPREFALLEVLMRNSGRIVTRTMLLEQVWDYNFDPNSTVIETYISRLRSKIDKPFDTPLLHTSRNVGYSLHGPR